MRLDTFEKILTLFEKGHGYMNFATLQKHKITITQINELERKSIITKISRGWYWCETKTIKKPIDYKYIEICKVNSNAVICLESACYIHGLLQKEPNVIKVATSREDRKNLNLYFPINRYYFSDLKNGISKIDSPYGSYNITEIDRCMCDCIRFKNRIDIEIFNEISDRYKNHKDRCKERLISYAKNLRATKNVKEYLEE